MRIIFLTIMGKYFISIAIQNERNFNVKRNLLTISYAKYISWVSFPYLYIKCLIKCFLLCKPHYVLLQRCLHISWQLLHLVSIHAVVLGFSEKQKQTCCHHDCHCKDEVGKQKEKNGFQFNCAEKCVQSLMIAVNLWYFEIVFFCIAALHADADADDNVHTYAVEFN